MSDPRFSILLSSRNEGESLRRTVDELFLRSAADAFEVIIVDDASEDGSADFLHDPGYSGKPIAALRNERRRGLIFSRARAADMARGSHLAFLDAHCAAAQGWLEGLAEELERVDGRGIVVPQIWGLRPDDWTIDPESLPARGCSISNPFLDFTWADPQRLDGLLCTCTVGGGAWMCAREWYLHIGGLDRGMVHWGGENVDIPLRTWVAGGWCLVADRISIGHLFKPHHPGNPTSGVDVIFNKIRAAHNVFSKRTFQRVLKNLSHLQGFEEALRRIHEDREAIGRLKAHVESIRKRSDDWLMETFRLPCLEPPFFHRPPRKKHKGVCCRPRPLVSVIVSGRSEGGELERAVSSVVEASTYGNYEVLVVSSGGNSGAPDFVQEGPHRKKRRVGHLHASARLEGGSAENLAAQLSQADFVAFLRADAVILDENWLEKLLLLFERHPRLLLASPRLKWIAPSGRPEGDGSDVFDVTWDWDAPGFSRARIGEPEADVPYQALSCPESLIFVHRERFIELGGFDRTLLQGPLPALDLAIQGWLSGYEVFCHPGVTAGRRRNGVAGDTACSRRSSPDWRDYAQALPAVKYFTNPMRLECCRQLSPEAEPLIERNRFYLERRRRQFLTYARFQDDWLFYKFNLEDLPNDGDFLSAGHRVSRAVSS